MTTLQTVPPKSVPGFVRGLTVRRRRAWDGIRHDLSHRSRNKPLPAVPMYADESTLPFIVASLTFAPRYSRPFTNSESVANLQPRQLITPTQLTTAIKRAVNEANAGAPGVAPIKFRSTPVGESFNGMTALISLNLRIPKSSGTSQMGGRSSTVVVHWADAAMLAAGPDRPPQEGVQALVGTIQKVLMEVLSHNQRAAFYDFSVERSIEAFTVHTMFMSVMIEWVSFQPTKNFEVIIW